MCCLSISEPRGTVLLLRVLFLLRVLLLLRLLQCLLHHFGDSLCLLFQALRRLVGRRRFQLELLHKVVSCILSFLEALPSLVLGLLDQACPLLRPREGEAGLLLVPFLLLTSLPSIACLCVVPLFCRLSDLSNLAVRVRDDLLTAGSPNQLAVDACRVLFSELSDELTCCSVPMSSTIWSADSWRGRGCLSAFILRSVAVQELVPPGLCSQASVSF